MKLFQRSSIRVIPITSLFTRVHEKFKGTALGNVVGLHRDTSDKRSVLRQRWLGKEEM